MSPWTTAKERSPSVTGGDTLAMRNNRASLLPFATVELQRTCITYRFVIALAYNPITACMGMS